jgi:hypothetical protein
MNPNNAGVDFYAALARRKQTPQGATVKSPLPPPLDQTSSGSASDGTDVAALLRMEEADDSAVTSAASFLVDGVSAANFDDVLHNVAVPMALSTNIDIMGSGTKDAKARLAAANTVLEMGGRIRGKGGDQKAVVFNFTAPTDIKTAYDIPIQQISIGGKDDAKADSKEA